MGRRRATRRTSARCSRCNARQPRCTVSQRTASAKRAGYLRADLAGSVGQRISISARRSETLVHEFAPLFQSIAATVGLFGLIADNVCKRGLSDFTREVGHIAGPVPEAGSEAVHGDIAVAHARQQPLDADRHFAPGERCTDAGVRAAAEGDVASEIEALEGVKATRAAEVSAALRARSRVSATASAPGTSGTQPAIRRVTDALDAERIALWRQFCTIAAGLQRISQLATDFPQIVEMDINPFIVGSPGRASVAADARITLKDVAAP